jgi:hypothetical protein
MISSDPFRLLAIASSKTLLVASGSWMRLTTGWLQHKDDRFYLLIGEPGMGKSAIALHPIQTRKDIVAYHLCQAVKLDTLKRHGYCDRSQSLKDHKYH